jgi:hypothetical protein
VADAIGALKLRAGVELLDRKMATLRQDISERAASAAKDFKACGLRSRPRIRALAHFVLVPLI